MKTFPKWPCSLMEGMELRLCLRITITIIFTQHGEVGFGATKDKSIQWQGVGFEPGTSGLQVQRPTTRPHLPPWIEGQRDKRNFKNLEFWPESLWVMLEYCYIKHSLLSLRKQPLHETSGCPCRIKCCDFSTNFVRYCSTCLTLPTYQSVLPSIIIR